MKKKSVKLAIDEPCHEDWNAMTPQEKGRYCKVCSKVVVDFTMMSDREVLNLLEGTKNGDTCGQLTQSQLGRSFHYPVEQTSSFNLRAVLLGATLTSVLGLESCKPEKHVVGKLGITQTTHSVQDDTLRNMQSDFNHFGEKYVSGRILDEKGAVVKNCTIALFSAESEMIASVVSDERGLFKIDLDWSKKPTYFLVSNPEYSSEVYQISKMENLIATVFVLSKINMNIRGNLRIVD